MYVDDVKLFAKNEKELENLIQAIKIYCQDIGMEFAIEKCAMMICRKRQMAEGIDLSIQEKLKRTEKRKITCT